jgi:hypothetical protein
VRFEIKNCFFYFEKRSSLPQRQRCCCNFTSRRIDSWVNGQDQVMEVKFQQEIAADFHPFLENNYNIAPRPLS